MAYLLLVQEQAQDRRTRPTRDGQQLMAQMAAYQQDLKARGLLLASDSLKGDAKGARVAIRDGRRSVLDGPFAEAKELVGGFFLIDCDSREQAIELASRCPAAEWATIEVREVGPCYE